MRKIRGYGIFGSVVSRAPPTLVYRAMEKAAAGSAITSTLLKNAGPALGNLNLERSPRPRPPVAGCPPPPPASRAGTATA